MDISELKNLMLLFKTEMETGDFQTYPETISVNGKNVGVKVIEDIETFKWDELEGEWDWLEEEISIDSYSSRRGLLLNSDVDGIIEYGFIGFLEAGNKVLVFDTEWGSSGLSLLFHEFEKRDYWIERIIRDIV